MKKEDNTDWNQLGKDFDKAIKEGTPINVLMMEKPNPQFHQFNNQSKTKHFKRK